MSFYGDLASIVNYMPVSSGYVAAPQKRTMKGKSDPLSGLLGQKVQCLSNILSDIQKDIGHRTTLTSRILNEIESHYLYVTTKFLEMYDWPITANRALEQRRITLEAQLDTLNLERRQEMVKSFQDTAKLKKEFRMWWKQYSDLMQRTHLVTRQS